MPSISLARKNLLGGETGSLAWVGPGGGTGPDSTGAMEWRKGLQSHRVSLTRLCRCAAETRSCSLEEHLERVRPGVGSAVLPTAVSDVTVFYRARTDIKMAIAAERLAVIAAITLPITSLSSVLSTNVIVNDSTKWYR